MQQILLYFVYFILRFIYAVFDCVELFVTQVHVYVNFFHEICIIIWSERFLELGLW